MSYGKAFRQTYFQYMPQKNHELYKRFWIILPSDDSCLIRLRFFGFFHRFLVENLFGLNDQAKSQAGGGQRMLHNVRFSTFTVDITFLISVSVNSNSWSVLKKSCLSIRKQANKLESSCCKKLQKKSRARNWFGE